MEVESHPLLLEKGEYELVNSHLPKRGRLWNWTSVALSHTLVAIATLILYDFVPFANRAVTASAGSVQEAPTLYCKCRFRSDITISNG